jgi:hypothetical protein
MAADGLNSSSAGFSGFFASSFFASCEGGSSFSAATAPSSVLTFLAAASASAEASASDLRFDPASGAAAAVPAAEAEVPAAACASQRRCSHAMISAASSTASLLFSTEQLGERPMRLSELTI